MKNPFIEFKNVIKKYRDFELRINFAIEKGSICSILGPSGSGKTTILRLLAGLETVSQGKILLLEKDITNAKPDKRNFGLVFQDYTLFPHLNVSKNIIYGMEVKKYSQDTISRNLSEVLNLVQMQDYAERNIQTLSGGEQQRIAIARALSVSPKLLLLDEPFSNIDTILKNQLKKELQQIQKKLGITIIFVTHNQNEALSISDKIILVNKGRIEQIGEPTQIYNYPKNTFVARFMGDANIIEGTVIRNQNQSEQREIVIEVQKQTHTLKKYPKHKDKIGEKIKFMIRPHKIFFCNPDEENAIEVKISRKEFLGYYNYFEVKNNRNTYIIYDTQNQYNQHYEINNNAFIKFKSDDIIILDD